MSVRARNISVIKQGRTIIDSISLDAFPQQVTGLIGPNGAGKSTLLSALAGDTPLTSGEVSCNGIDVAHASAAQLARVRSVMLQDVTVNFGFLVRDVVEMGRTPWGKHREDRFVVDSALKAAGIEHLQDRHVTTLSGGELARVALARVLAQNTQVVFLDEPTAAMDVKNQEETMGTARTLAQHGKTVVVVLHDLSLAAAYCDRVVCLKQGRIAAAGLVEEVYTDKTLSETYNWDVSVVKSPQRLHESPRRSLGRLEPDSPLLSSPD